MRGDTYLSQSSSSLHTLEVELPRNDGAVTHGAQQRPVIQPPARAALHTGFARPPAARAGIIGIIPGMGMHTMTHTQEGDKPALSSWPLLLAP